MDGVRIMVGDIVKYQDSPTEILTVDKDHKGIPIFFAINKRTLEGEFIYRSEFEFVRRSEKRKKHGRT